MNKIFEYKRQQRFLRQQIKNLDLKIIEEQNNCKHIRTKTTFQPDYGNDAFDVDCLICEKALVILGDKYE